MRVTRWKPALQTPGFIRDRFIPYGVPILSLLALLVIGWYMANNFSTPDVCAKWSDLQDLDISQSRYFALGIGINDYSQVDGYASLHTPAKDAKRILQILETQYGFEPVQGPPNKDTIGSVLLISGSPNSEPTLDNIRRALIVFASTLTETDALLVYYAGHGLGQKDDIFGKWIPQDGDTESEYIDHWWLQQICMQCNARHILLVVDCCYSAKFINPGPTRGKPIYTIPPKPSEKQQDLLNWPSRQGIASGYYETVPDGEAHSPFAACCIHALTKNTTAFMSASELFKDILSCTEASKFAKKPFMAVIENTCDQQGEFFFKLRQDGSLYSLLLKEMRAQLTLCTRFSLRIAAQYGHQVP